MRCCLAFASGLPVKSHTGSPLVRGGWYVKLIRRTRTRIHGNLWRTDRLDLRCCSSAVVERGDRNLTRLCEPRSLEDRKKAAPFRARPKLLPVQPLENAVLPRLVQSAIGGWLIKVCEQRTAFQVRVTPVAALPFECHLDLSGEAGPEAVELVR